MTASPPLPVPALCPKCDGEGEVSGYEPGGFRAMFTCRECDGAGTIAAPPLPVPAHHQEIIALLEPLTKQREDYICRPVTKAIELLRRAPSSAQRDEVLEEAAKVLKERSCKWHREKENHLMSHEPTSAYMRFATKAVEASECADLLRSLKATGEQK